MVIITPTEMVGVIGCLGNGCIQGAKWEKILATNKMPLIIISIT
jgi:hypothetical protein